MKTRIFVIIACLCLTGCSTTISTRVEGFSTLPSTKRGYYKMVFIVPFEGQDVKSLAWRKNKDTLVQQLKWKGYLEVSSQDDANYIAYFGFSIDEGERITTNYSIPQWGVTGYSGANTYGTIYGNSYSAYTTLTPTYGVTGYSQYSTTKLVFTRSAKLAIDDKETGNRVFESVASSTGSCHSFTPIAPYIIASILHDFPKGKTGALAYKAEDFECQ